MRRSTVLGKPDRFFPIRSRGMHIFSSEYLVKVADIFKSHEVDDFCNRHVTVFKILLRLIKFEILQDFSIAFSSITFY